MDYNKINKIDTDGNGNIVLQDVNGSTITVNYNDIETLKSLFQSISETQMFEIKHIIGSQNKEILSELRKIQDKLDEQNTKAEADKILNEIDEFFKEIASLKTDSAKKRILMNYKQLREYEELLILEDDPKRKMRYDYQIETVKGNISQAENELKQIAR